VALHAERTHEGRAQYPANIGPLAGRGALAVLVGRRPHRVGGERGIVVLVTPEAFEIRLPTVEWTGGTHSPVPSTRLWRRLRADRVDDTTLEQVLSRAEAARTREFRPCRFCRREVPVEHRTGAACHPCASRHTGTAY
jgi:hypothetical protein